MLMAGATNTVHRPDRGRVRRSQRPQVDHGRAEPDPRSAGLSYPLLDPLLDRLAVCDCDLASINYVEVRSRP